MKQSCCGCANLTVNIFCMGIDTCIEQTMGASLDCIANSVFSGAKFVNIYTTFTFDCICKK